LRRAGLCRTMCAMASGAAAEADWSVRRADARRNHERVLAAAVEVFTEHGLDATIPQVAERAGVGKATVYRSYPTKADLVRAIAQLHVDWLRERIGEAAAAAEEDAYAALGSFLEQLATRLAEDRLMVEVMARVVDIEEVRRDDRAGLRLLALGREQGTLRSDVTMFDVRVLVSGFARALIELEESDPAVWRRYARLTLAALRR
jgi:AcrR family transcriptional regulator